MMALMVSSFWLRISLAMSMLSLCDARSSIPCVVVDVAVDGHGSRRQMATNAVMPMPMAKPSRMAWWGFIGCFRLLGGGCVYRLVRCHLKERQRLGQPAAAIRHALPATASAEPEPLTNGP